MVASIPASMTVLNSRVQIMVHKGIKALIPGKETITNKILFYKIKMASNIGNNKSKTNDIRKETLPVCRCNKIIVNLV